MIIPSKGLCPGDLIIKFGPLTVDNVNGSLQPIAQQVERNENVLFPKNYCYPSDYDSSSALFCSQFREIIK